MGAHRYCECGQGLPTPTAENLLYGKKCPNCDIDEKFSTEDKVDFLLYEFIEKEDREDRKNKFIEKLNDEEQYKL